MCSPSVQRWFLFDIRMEYGEGWHKLVKRERGGWWRGDGTRRGREDTMKEPRTGQTTDR